MDGEIEEIVNSGDKDSGVAAKVINYGGKVGRFFRGVQVGSQSV